MKIKPEFKNLIPKLTNEEFKSLEESIKSEGCRDALILWNDFIIDGHNRFEICNKNKIKFKTIYKKLKDENEVKEWIIKNQISRRNLSIEAKYMLIAELSKLYEIGGGFRSDLQPTLPYNVGENVETKTAKVFGVSPSTVQKARKYKKIIDENPELKTQINMNITKILNEVKKEERKKKEEIQRKQAAKEGSKLKLKDTIDLRQGDFKKVLKDIDKVDAIITDPPYPKEFLHLWDELGEFAKEKLKDNGYLICYSGQLHIPEVLERLCKHLDYVWTFCLYHEGQTQIVNGVNVMCRWKPVFIFQKKKTKFKRVIQDYVISEKREKSGHNWQQGLSAVKKFVELFSKEGEIVCDPFSGSGTTAMACKETNRKFIGAELDEEYFNASKKRLK